MGYKNIVRNEVHNILLFVHKKSFLAIFLFKYLEFKIFKIKGLFVEKFNKTKNKYIFLDLFELNFADLKSKLSFAMYMKNKIIIIKFKNK